VNIITLNLSLEYLSLLHPPDQKTGKKLTKRSQLKSRKKYQIKKNQKQSKLGKTLARDVPADVVAAA